MRDDLQAAYDRGHRTLAEMTPAPRWQHRLGFVAVIATGVLVVSGFFLAIMLPAIALYELAFGR
jgi:hypothetical protein